MTARHPEIGNDYSIVDHKALRKAEIPNNEIDKFCDQALVSPESELLQICGQWVTLVP